MNRRWRLAVALTGLVAVWTAMAVPATVADTFEEGAPACESFDTLATGMNETELSEAGAYLCGYGLGAGLRKGPVGVIVGLTRCLAIVFADL